MKNGTFLYDGVKVRKRNGLPHWDVPAGIYFVTYHLADAITQVFCKDQESRKLRFLNDARLRFGRVRPVDLRTIEKGLRRELFEELDRARGACHLQRPEIANVVAEAFCHFDQVRYRLITYSVMPNHVHVIFQPNPENPWWKIVGGWKSYTAKEANRLLSRTGSFWQDDNFDRLIRNERHLQLAIQYVLNNPIKAGLQEWPWVRNLMEEARG